MDDTHVKDTSRREFLRGLGAIPVMAMAHNGAPVRAALPAPGPTRMRTAPVPAQDRKLVGIQIGARSFVDEGVDACLDTLQEVGGVNTLMATTFTYGTGLAGRQVRGRPLPDHGVQEYDQVYGGSYTAVHPEYFQNSVIRDIRAPELGDFDILADVIPAARARGMQTYCLFEEAYNPRRMRNFEAIAQVDVYGRVGPRPCHNNPHTRTFVSSMVEDWFKSNDLDGLMWESERQGPLNNMIGAHIGSVTGRMTANCFCQYCVPKARGMGIDVERAREGYMALDRMMRSGLNRPNEGDRTFMRFWRLLVEYPEIMAWHRFWFHSQEEMYGLIYGTVKSINPQAQVGWHIMFYVSLSPFFMADQNFARIARYADYIKPASYHNSGGPRLATFVRNIQSTIFRDFTEEEILRMLYRMLELENEASLADLPTAGLTPEYLANETRRLVDEVGGEIPIYPGIDVDVPTALDAKQTTPEDVKAGTLAAFRAGAGGIVLSRKYAEMRLTNMAGARDALEELGYL